jgi:hypothetical protein
MGNETTETSNEYPALRQPSLLSAVRSQVEPTNGCARGSSDPQCNNAVYLMRRKREYESRENGFGKKDCLIIFQDAFLIYARRK